MKKTKALFLNTVLLTACIFADKSLGQNLKLNQTPGIAFTENKGQVHDQNYQPRTDVLYGAMAGNMAFHLKTTGVSYQLYRIDKYKEVMDETTRQSRKEIAQQTIYRIDLNWLNCNKNLIKTEDEVLPGYTNYYSESCPTGALNVKSYRGVILHDLYKGIDLHYYEKNGVLKHDYIVAPHTDYKQIQIQVKGAEVRVSPDGSLLLTTPLGKVQEGAPIVYQNNKQLKAKWLITQTEQGQHLSFEIENYNSNYKLIIDPITRLWGTYYGGTGDEVGYSCITDASGDVFMAGYTASNTSTLIATTGSHQSTFGGPSSDAFLVKFNTNGIRQWATYYGGLLSEYGHSCTTDASGNIYLAGYTNSNNSIAIATPGSHQSVSGGAIDAFLVKFDGNGIRQWGTYYGGSGDEVAHSCATDASGNVYMCGSTSSNIGTVIATSGSHQTAYGGGTGFGSDAFLVKFNSNGVRQWGTYYGGAGNEYLFNDKTCVTDVNGNVYLTGQTTSSTGIAIATPGSHQPAYGGSFDSFLVKFNSNGVRQWGTYYGGTATDRGVACATDASGNAYLLGATASSVSAVIATIGSHQPVYGGSYDAFLVKFNSNGVRQWGTFYGGAGAEDAGTCVVDMSGNVYFSGMTNISTGGTVIATAGSYQSANAGGNDAFLAIFDANGTRQWSSYYGGTSVDMGSSCTVDTGGNIYMVGTTNTSTGTAIATPGSHQPNLSISGSTYDSFLVKFRDCDIMSPIALGTASVCSGSSINLSVSISGTVAPVYTWTGPNSYTSAIQNPGISNASTLNVGVYTVAANNVGCIETATVQVASADPTITVSSGSICTGNTFVIAPNGAGTYTITGGSFTVSPTTQTSYSIVGTSASGCASGNTAVATVTVNALPTVSVNSGIICSGSNFVLTPGGANTYTITGGSFTVSPTTQTSYSVTGQSVQGCISSNTAVATVSVNATPSISVSSDNNVICAGDLAILTASGGATYIFTPGGPGYSITVSPTVTSTYTVVGTGINGCSNMTLFIQNVDACTNITSLESFQSTPRVYPNPTSGVIKLEVLTNSEVTIVNTLGQIVYSLRFEKGNHEISFENLPNGAYLLTLNNHEETIKKKIIKH